MSRRTNEKKTIMLEYLDGYDDMDELGFLKKKNRKKPAKVAKIGLVAARKAFLTAVSLNLLKLAEKLDLAIKKNPARIRQFWFAQGGKPDKLWAAIAKGKSRKGAKRRAGMSGVPALPAALASALPILIAVIKIFKELNIKQDDGENKSLVDKMKDALNLDPGTKKDTYRGPGFDVGKTGATDPSPGASEDPGDTGAKKGGKSNLPLIIGGVAAVGAIGYALTRK